MSACPLSASSLDPLSPLLYPLARIDALLLPLSPLSRLSKPFRPNRMTLAHSAQADRSTLTPAIQMESTIHIVSSNPSTPACEEIQSVKGREGGASLGLVLDSTGMHSRGVGDAVRRLKLGDGDERGKLGRPSAGLQLDPPNAHPTRRFFRPDQDLSLVAPQSSDLLQLSLAARRRPEGRPLLRAA